MAQAIDCCETQSTQVSSNLAFLKVDISDYFNAGPPFNNVRFGALIFTSPPQQPLLLLVQVAAISDPSTSSASWELPGGFPLKSDKNLLHALARVVKEQTGLQLCGVGFMAGSERDKGPQISNDQRSMKLYFTVEVQDNKNLTGTNGSRSISIFLHQSKHHRYACVRENDLQEFIKSGLYPANKTNQYQLMLNAFELRRRACFPARSAKDFDSPQISSKSSPAVRRRAISASYRRPSKPVISRGTNKREGWQIPSRISDRNLLISSCFRRVSIRQKH